MGGVCDPLLPRARGRSTASQHRRLLVRGHAVAHERNRYGGLGARQDDVESLDRESTASARSVLHDPDRRPDALAVAEGEYGDDDATREFDLVVERPDEWTVLIAEGAPGAERVRRERGRVDEHVVQDIGGYDAVNAGRIERVERGEYNRAVGIAEGRGNDL